jgi:hypothetical protein
VKELAGWILRGRSQAVLMISTTGLLGLLILPFSIFSGAAVALVALRNSFTETAAVLLLAAGVCTVFLLTMLNRADLALELLFVWSLLACSAAVLRKTANLALALPVIAAGALGVIGWIYLNSPDPVAKWKEVLLLVWQNLGLETDPAQLRQQADTWAPLMTGIVAVAFLYTLSVCLFIGRWWQALLYNPGGFAQEFRGLRFGQAGTLLVAAVCLLTWWLESEFWLAVALVLAAVYALQGLAVVHRSVDGRKGGTAWLFVCYSVIFLLPYAAKLFICLLGLVDAWVDFRRRWLDKPASSA